MSIKITGNYFGGGKVGISAPADIKGLEIGQNEFDRVETAIELRTPTSILAALGLSEQAPLGLVRELLAFAAEKHRQPEELEHKAHSIGVLNWLAAGANVTTLLTGLAQLYPHLPAILAALPG